MAFKNREEYHEAINKKYDKPTVMCKILTEVIVGERMAIIAYDHPAEYLNGKVAYTSSVRTYDKETGEFTTRNTHYIPFKEDEKSNADAADSAE